MFLYLLTSVIGMLQLGWWC